MEADFLVNLYEDGAEAPAVKTALDKIFRTETGIRLCRDMFRCDGPADFRLREGAKNRPQNRQKEPDATASGSRWLKNRHTGLTAQSERNSGSAQLKLARMKVG